MLAVLHRGWAVPWFAPLDSLLVPAPPRAKAADGGKKKSVWLQRDDADADTDKGILDSGLIHFSIWTFIAHLSSFLGSFTALHTPSTVALRVVRPYWRLIGC